MYIKKTGIYKYKEIERITNEEEGIKIKSLWFLME